MRFQTLLIVAFLSHTFIHSAQAEFHFGDPPDAHHPWAVHDTNRPQPPRVEPADTNGGAPSDAVVLFDGTEASFANWVHQTPDDKRKANWIVTNGYMLVTKGAGYIASKEHFGDCQLHIEWSHEKQLPGSGQGRGNSGVFLMGQIEVQVLDNYENPTYPDGSAGCVYGVMPPAANALRAPGKWQSYDIIFRRPIVKEGVCVDEGSMTVLMNGVVVQDSTPLDGGGGHKKRKPLNHAYPNQGPLTMQDHGNPVRFRNIWYRKLRPRPSDGGTDGRLSVEDTKAKRSAIAKTIFDDAMSLNGFQKMTRLLESYMYDQQAKVWAQCNTLVTGYVDELKGLEAKELGAFKRDALHLEKILKYLIKHQMLDPNYSPSAELSALAIKQDWIKKK